MFLFYFKDIILGKIQISAYSQFTFYYCFCRRLCPDISFFQQATDFPCQEIVGGSNSDSIRLHNRVQYTALNAGSVERRGIGMNKV